MRPYWTLGEIIEAVRSAVTQGVALPTRIDDHLIVTALEATLGELAVLAGPEDPVWWKETVGYLLPGDALLSFPYPQPTSTQRLWALPVPENAFDVVHVGIGKDENWSEAARISLSELITATSSPWTSRRLYSVWGSIEDETKVDPVFHTRFRVLWILGEAEEEVRATYRVVPRLPRVLDAATLGTPVVIPERYEEIVLALTALKVAYLLGARPREIVALGRQLIRSFEAVMSIGERQGARGDVPELIRRLEVLENARS